MTKLPADYAVSYQEVRRIFDYEPATGYFTWKRRPELKQNWNTHMAGQRAGVAVKDGYIVICINRAKYRAHRLAFLYMTGQHAPDEIDHIDRNKHNNAWANLRAATHAENCANQPMRKNNTSGHRGVTWSKNRNKWFVQYMRNGIKYNAGYFVDYDEAVAASNATMLAPAHELVPSTPRDQSHPGISFDTERNKWSVRKNGEHWGRYPTKQEAIDVLESGIKPDFKVPLGICFDKNRNKWVARYGSHHIGRYETREQAVEARENYLRQI